MRVPLLLIASLFGAVPPLTAETSIPALGALNQSGTPLFSTSTFTPASIGYQFTALTDIRIVSMGVFDLGGDGLTTAADVGIYDTAGELLRRVAIPTTAPLRGDFRYQPLDSPLVIAAGTSLRLAHFVSADPWVFRADITDFSSLIQYNGSVSSTLSNSAGLTYPNNFTNRREYLGTDFEFQVVPEPSSFVIFSLSACLALRRRRSVGTEKFSHPPLPRSA